MLALAQTTLCAQVQSMKDASLVMCGGLVQVFCQAPRSGNDGRMPPCGAPFGVVAPSLTPDALQSNIERPSSLSGFYDKKYRKKPTNYSCGAV